jgi:hypothetical protein
LGPERAIRDFAAANLDAFRSAAGYKCIALAAAFSDKQTSLRCGVADLERQ